MGKNRWHPCGVFFFQCFEHLLSTTHRIENQKKLLGCIWGGEIHFFWQELCGMNVEGLGMVGRWSRLVDFGNVPSNPASQNQHGWGSWRMLNHRPEVVMCRWDLLGCVAFCFCCCFCCFCCCCCCCCCSYFSFFFFSSSFVCWCSSSSSSSSSFFSSFFVCWCFSSCC